MTHLNKLDLLSGGNFITEDGITVKHPQLHDIVHIGERVYLSFVSTFCAKPADCMVLLDDLGFDYRVISDYQLFVLLMQINLKNLVIPFKKFLNIEKIAVDIQRSMISGFIGEKQIIIKPESYAQISTYLRIINCYTNKEDPRPKSDTVKEILIELERDELSSKQDNEDVFANLVSSLIWDNGNGTNYGNVWDLYIYQFQDGIRRRQKIKDFSNLMQGVYTGNIDMKKNRRQLQKANWLTPIDNN